MDTTTAHQIYGTPLSFPDMTEKEFYIKRTDDAMTELVFVLEDGYGIEFMSSIKPFTERIDRGTFIQWIKRADGKPDILTLVFN